MPSSRVHGTSDLGRTTRFGCALETVLALVLVVALAWLGVRACSQPIGTPAPVIPPEPAPLRMPYP